MTYPTYFSYFPNIEYPIKMNRAGVVEHVKTKDIFHLMKVRERLNPKDTIYEPYNIPNGMRPDQVAKELYGSPSYYWLVMHVAEVVDPYQDWPLSSYELDEFILKKYGGVVESNQVHHYETVVVYDSEGNLVQPGRGGPGPDRGGLAQNGLEVSANHSVTYPSYPGSDVFITRSGSSGPLAACTPVSNRMYEYDLNQDKSQIFVLQKQYLPDYVREVRRFGERITDNNTQLDIADY